MKLKIIKVKNGDFDGDDGERIKYNWIKATREGDGVTIQFGTRKDYVVGEMIDVELDKTELANGKFRYTEPSED